MSSVHEIFHLLMEEDGTGELAWDTKKTARKMRKKSTSTIHRMIARGELEAVKEGRRTMVPVLSVAKHYAQARSGGVAAA